MHRSLRGFTAVTLALAVLAANPGGAQAARGELPSVDIWVEDASDRFVGTGGLVLPASVATDTRREVAECTDCRWRLREPCAGVFAPGCIIILHACAGIDEQLLRAWLSHDGGATWQNRGLICISEGGPVTVAATGVAIQDNFERIMPRGRITFQPGRGVLPYLPVIFHSGQPQSVPPTTYQVAGQEVVLSPTPRWGWDFGDGTGLATHLAGSAYPDRTVAHSYARGGRFEVVVTTIWSATFTVAGLGPFPIQAPVTQTETTVVQVGQARGVLIP
ncbi:MAG: PKD domain-containing protein [Actinomycetota bacterium]|nr:PKD domain-containing protein [Actinomycetota bacterium]